MKVKVLLSLTDEGDSFRNQYFFMLPNIILTSVQYPRRKTGGLLLAWLYTSTLFDELSEVLLWPNSLLASEQTHTLLEADRAGAQIGDRELSGCYLLCP